MVAAHAHGGSAHGGKMSEVLWVARGCLGGDTWWEFDGGQDGAETPFWGKLRNWRWKV